MNGTVDAVLWAGGGDRSGVYSLLRANAELRRFEPGADAPLAAPAELSLREHARPTALAALSNTAELNGVSHVSRTKKRSRTSKGMASAVDSSERVVVGMSDGTLVFLEGKPDGLKEAHSVKGFSSPVACLAIDSAKNRVWAMANDHTKHVCIAWDWKAAHQVARLKRTGPSSLGESSRIAVSDDGSLLATASSVIEVYSVTDSGEISLQKELVGHPSAVTCLEFIPHSQMLLSGCSGDSFVSMWDCAKDAPQAAVKTFQALDAPTRIVTKKLGEDSSTFSFAVLSKDHEVSLWNSCAFPKGSDQDFSKPAKPDLRIICDGRNDSIHHLVWQFDETLQCFHGNDMRPTVKNVSTSETETVRLPAPPVAKTVGLETHARFRGDASARVVAGGTLLASGEAVLDEQNVSVEPRLAENQTMADKLKSIGIVPKALDEVDEKSLDRKQETSGGESVAVLLAQAVRTKDGQLLEEALQAVSKRSAVLRTVKKLPVEVVPSLLEALVNRFQSRPRRAATLVLWIRLVVSEHLGVIMGSSVASAALKRLRQSCEDRVHPFEKLMALQGRLDLVVSVMRSRTDAEGNIDKNPGTEFVEKATRPMDEDGEPDEDADLESSEADE